MAIHFDEWVWDGESRELRRHDRRVHLSPKAFDLLGLLLRQRPRVVSAAEAGAVLWPDTFVSKASLSVVVSELRRVLGDSRRQPRFVRTIHRHGYAFCAEASDVRGARGSTPAVSPELHWQGRVVPLGPGENVLGRSPESVVAIASTKVSRRHARIVLTSAGDCVLEDLGSKNGTWVSGRRLEAAIVLRDGDRIGVGPVELTFRARVLGGSTETAAPEATDEISGSGAAAGEGPHDE